MKCTVCGEPHERLNQRLCHSCHAAYMRSWRNEHPRSGTHRKRKWHKLSEHLEVLA